MQYIKYIPFILVGISFLLAVYFIFTRDHLLKFVVESMKTDGKPDGKKMSGFVLVNSLVAGFFVAIYYAKEHLPPEYYVWCIAGLIASFYGIREVGRFINGKYGPPQDTTSADPGHTQQTPVPQSNPVNKNTEENKQNNNSNQNSEIG